MDSLAAIRDNLELLHGYHIACFYSSKKTYASILKEFVAHARQNNVRISHIRSVIDKKVAIPLSMAIDGTSDYSRVFYPRILSADIKHILKREYNKSQKKGHLNPGIILEIPTARQEISLDEIVSYLRGIKQFIKETNCPVLCMYNQKNYSTKTLLYIFRFHDYIIFNDRIVKNSYHCSPEQMTDQTKFFDIELQNWFNTLHEKQHTEHLLTKEKSLLENTISMNPNSVSIYDSEGYFIMCNQSFRDVFGIEPSPSYSIFEDPVLLSDPIHRRLVSELKEGKSPKSSYYMWYNPKKTNPKANDKDVLVRGVAFPILDKSGKIDKFIVFHEDVTRQEEQKLELLQSQTQYEFIFNEVSDGIVYTDTNGVILDINPAITAITGIPRQDLINQESKKIIKKYLDPREAKRILKQMEHFECGNPQKAIDTLIIEYKDKVLELRGPLKRTYEKAPAHRTVLIRDITQQQQLEKNLFADNAHLDRLIKSKAEDLTRLNEQMKTEISERIAAEEKLKAYNHDLKFLGEMALRFLDFSGQDNSYEFIANQIITLTKAPLVIILKFEQIYQQFNCETIAGIDPKIREVFKLFRQDIMKIQIPYDALMKKWTVSPSLRQFNGGFLELLQETIPSNICITIEKMLKIKQIHFLGLTWKKEPYGLIVIFSKSRADYLKNPEIIETFVRMASLSLKQQHDMTELNQSCSNAEQLVAERTQALLHANLNLQIEINRRKKNESKIRASLKEKDELLREVHHRVKNNLQIIISLLNMQLRYTEEKAVQEVLTEYRNRIYSIAIIHESFYRSNHLSEIDIKKYLQSLIRHLLKYYHGDPNHIQIKIKAAKQPIPLHLAIPCGIIFNEMILNSIQYAFPPQFDKKPKIEIQLKIEGSMFNIRFSDNGIGIPDDVNINSFNGLGLELINILIKQLNGTVKINKDHGTVLNIRFDLNQ